MATHLWSGHTPRSIRDSQAWDAAAAAAGAEPACLRRVAVMGPPGSGKSTVARHLGERFGLPVFHLDQVWWRAGWIEAPPDEFAAEVERIAALPAWVIDGNFTAMIGPRFRAADTVVYLDIPSWLSVIRVTTRMLLGHGRVRPDMPQGCPEKFDLAFLLFTWNWNRERRTRNLGLVAAFGGRTIVLRGRRAVRQFLGRGPRTAPTRIGDT